ncbi:hypothetical protein AURDEDRAFT_52680 [Auricularia subglabra TFB-10046 SS5]|nr:hypothetical protein AURDEDRAFT_52680 [Auricularia subglabra TFB-10046 SS5]
MEWVPRHRQPFTWEQLLELSVPEITQEIARLQHSLEHLRKTQDELEEHVAASPDPEISAVIEENNTVMCVSIATTRGRTSFNQQHCSASQTERVQMMRLALQAKGFTQASNPHYDIAPERSTAATANANQPALIPVPAAPAETSESVSEDGVYL